MQTSGVRQVDDAAGEHQRALHQIARRAGNRGHNRLFLAQQRVKQARFAHVRLPAQRNAKPRLQQPRGALVAGVRQRFRQMRNARRKVARGFLFADFLRIVNARRHARLNGVQFVRRLADERRRAPCQLAHGGFAALLALRGD